MAAGDTPPVDTRTAGEQFWNGVVDPVNTGRRVLGDAAGAGLMTAAGADNVAKMIASFGGGGAIVQGFVGFLAMAAHFLGFKEFAENLRRESAIAASATGTIDDLAVGGTNGTFVDNGANMRRTPGGPGGTAGGPGSGLTELAGNAAGGAIAGAGIYGGYKAVTSFGTLGRGLLGTVVNAVTSGRLNPGIRTGAAPGVVDPARTGHGWRGLAVATVTGAVVGAALGVTGAYADEGVPSVKLADGTQVFSQEEINVYLEENNLTLAEESKSPMGFYAYNEERGMLVPLEALEGTELLPPEAMQFFREQSALMNADAPTLKRTSALEIVPGAEDVAGLDERTDVASLEPISFSRTVGRTGAKLDTVGCISNIANAAICNVTEPARVVATALNVGTPQLQPTGMA
jgi:hypothetical protein